MIFGIIRLWLYMSMVKPIVALPQIIILHLWEHILKYLADTNTRINDLRNLGVSGLDIIQHCFLRPSTQGHSEEKTEESQTVDTSAPNRRTLSRRARSSRATSRILSAPVEVPLATLRHLPTRPIASTGQ